MLIAKLDVPELKIYYILHIHYTRLLKKCQSFFEIIFIFSVFFLMRFSYVSSFPDRLIPRQVPPYPKVLSLPRLSYLSAYVVAKYNLISQRALGDFARGVLPRPFEPPAFESPEVYLYFALSLCRYVPAMPILCPRYAPFMYFLWAWYVTFHGHSVGMALLVFRVLSSQRGN